MSKKLTPLEAWKLIDKSGTIETLCIIETALKRNEKLEKAFRIITEKKVDYWWEIESSSNYENYLDTKNWLCLKLTKEEFDLLKELLK